MKFKIYIFVYAISNLIKVIQEYNRALDLFCKNNEVTEYTPKLRRRGGTRWGFFKGDDRCTPLF